MNTIDYHKQAEDFTKETGITIAFQYTGHTSRMGSKVPTAQFRVTISREGRKPWTFDYSDCIADSYRWEDGERKNYTYIREWKPMPHNLYDKKETGTGRTPDDAMRDAATTDKAVRWGGSYYVKRHIPTPTAYDVLACLQKSDPGSHADFCADFGTDPDSIKGRETFLAVVDEWQNVKRLFTEAELERLQEIS